MVESQRNAEKWVQDLLHNPFIFLRDHRASLFQPVDFHLQYKRPFG